MPCPRPTSCAPRLRPPSRPRRHLLRVPIAVLVGCAILAVLATPAAADVGRTYSIRSGDTLVSIADRLGVAGGADALYRTNRGRIGGDPNRIRPGLLLRLPATSSAVHVVLRGENLSEIAERLAIRGGAAALYAANRTTIGADPDLLHPGLPLRLPGRAEPGAGHRKVAESTISGPAAPAGADPGPTAAPSPSRDATAPSQTSAARRTSERRLHLVTALVLVALAVLVAWLSPQRRRWRRRSSRTLREVLPAGAAPNNRSGTADLAAAVPAIAAGVAASPRADTPADPPPQPEPQAVRNLRAMMHAGPDELLRALAHLLDDWPTDDGLRELSRSVDQRLPSMLANPPGTVRRELALSVLADIDRHFRAVVVRPAAAREPLQRLVAVLGRDAVSRNRGRQVSRDLLDSWAATSSSPRWHGELERTRERLQALAVHPAASWVIGELDAFYNRRHREVEQHTARLVRTLRLREESWATTRSESVADGGAGTDGGDSEVPEDAEPETVWSHAIRPPPP